MEVRLSEDGATWSAPVSVENEMPVNTEGAFAHELSVSFDAKPVRFVNVKARNLGFCPDWHRGAGDRAWLFADEVVVE